jgi:hypothetical protein
MTQPLSHGRSITISHCDLFLEGSSIVLITDGAYASRRLILSAVFNVLKVSSRVEESSCP